MTTVVDPTGTPTIIFNRSGTTILTMVGGFTTNPDFPIGNQGVDIPRLSETTVVLANITTDGNGGWNLVFRLPADADIGDIVEIYCTGGPRGPVMFPQIGEVIMPRAVSTGTNNSAGLGASQLLGWRYRKVSSTSWVAMGNEPT